MFFKTKFQCFPTDPVKNFWIKPWAIARDHMKALVFTIKKTNICLTASSPCEKQTKPK